MLHSSASLPALRWLMLATALLCLSCSGSGTLYPVTGKALYKNNPIAGASLTFHPEGADDLNVTRPVGIVKEDGSFTLMTGQKEGALAGGYTVTIIWNKEPAGGKGKKVFSTAPPEIEDRLQGAYANRSTSTLKVQIKPGTNQLEPFLLK